MKKRNVLIKIGTTIKESKKQKCIQVQRVTKETKERMEKNKGEWKGMKKMNGKWKRDERNEVGNERNKRNEVGNGKDEKKGKWKGMK